jgi:hypothetical protein
MKTIIYHTVGTIPKSNRNIAEKGKIDTPNTYIHYRLSALKRRHNPYV